MGTFDTTCIAYVSRINHATSSSGAAIYRLSHTTAPSPILAGTRRERARARPRGTEHTHHTAITPARRRTSLTIRAHAANQLPRTQPLPHSLWRHAHATMLPPVQPVSTHCVQMHQHTRTRRTRTISQTTTPCMTAPCMRPHACTRTGGAPRRPPLAALTRAPRAAARLGTLPSPTSAWV